ncbi:helix-turn-helix domain-containing protein [Salmonella enterica]|nr:helix-turn-helix domain-containing protein [Salmonella enterica]ELI2232708.1 helix-turn-helix domain-containing protein [Salmonella enterica]ELJ1656582.1 helix-turn-helix domain-containing protein [Salmonella enterica]ELL0279880.1 helix-turn-helix domain-containing protein [Salmonella enterica]
MLLIGRDTPLYCTRKWCNNDLGLFEQFDLFRFCLLANGTSRRQVALIYNVAITTLYKKFPASVIHNIG